MHFAGILNVFFFLARQPAKLVDALLNGTEQGFFDERWYIWRYPDAARSFRAPCRHFRARSHDRDPHPLFDTTWYQERYGQELFGAAPIDHYLANCHSGRFQPHPLFDPAYYSSCAITPDSREPLFDYLTRGWKEGFGPNPLFDPSWYLGRYPDVAHQFEPLTHYVRYGEQERRLPHPLFDPTWYRAKNSDLPSQENALAHFLNYGSSEGRDPHPLFSNAWYAHHEPAIDARDGMLLHFLAGGWASGRNPHPLFDSEHYLKSLGNSVLGNPLLHYLDHRDKSWGQPNAYFDTAWYLKQYPDVMKAGINPLVHFVTTGAEEGRDPSPQFLTKRYIEEYRDVRFKRMNPLAHFMHYGLREGRSPMGSTRVFGVAEGRSLHDRNLRTKLDAFMLSGKTLRFVRSERPILSVILVTYGAAHHSFACFESLLTCLDYGLDYEIILFDNNSGGEAERLLSRLQGIMIVRSQTNLGFLRGANAAALKASGEFLLFINNDAQVTFGSVEAAVELLRLRQSCGAVGAKLILPDGSLQEAGSIIWSDGSCLGYARGKDPNAFEASFQREVDYCSGAFLMTRRALFFHIGPFDEGYAPGYYEETDYCLKLRQNGLRVIYDPKVVVFHFEFATAASAEAAAEQQATNQIRFKALHQARLSDQLDQCQENILTARHGDRRALRVLVIDDKVPHLQHGSGFPRARALMNGLASLGIFITLFPTDEREQDWAKVRLSLDPTIEVVCGLYRSDVMSFIKDRHGYYDAYFASRPHNIEIINNALVLDRDALSNRPLFYDCEAIFAQREISRCALSGQPLDAKKIRELLKAETELARFAKTVFCVSKPDRDLLEDYGVKDVRVLGHSIAEAPGDCSFSERADILFVGAIFSDATPNGDSILWFLDEIYPLIAARTAEPIRFIMAGVNKSTSISRRLQADVIALGAVEDLTPIYNRARICIAPTRFAAGIPHKVHEAAGHGVPVVTTPLLAAQLQWRDREDVLVGRDAASFARACLELYQGEALWNHLRTNALAAVRRDCSEALFQVSLEGLRDEIAGTASSAAVYDSGGAKNPRSKSLRRPHEHEIRSRQLERP